MHFNNIWTIIIYILVNSLLPNQFQTKLLLNNSGQKLLASYALIVFRRNINFYLK